MGKKILYLSFYFEPDLCAGSFRNSPLAYELARQSAIDDIEIDLITTLPNRYSTFSKDAPTYERKGNLSITRIKIPAHKSGLKDQILSFKRYFSEVIRTTRNKKYDLVFASSSRLFTAYLGYVIAKKRGIPLYLDIRDIFVDTINDVFRNPLIRSAIVPFMSYIEKHTFGYAAHINLISGGFKSYFTKYPDAKYSEFSNGIDPIFREAALKKDSNSSGPKIVIYAGNIGEGQGLHKVIPAAAKELGKDYIFRVIGDGGAKHKLINEVGDLDNVELLPPTNRDNLIEEYLSADYLFMHLNDLDAFKKVLPSKVFELGVFSKPLIAGVNGYAREFVKENLPGSIIVDPCDGIQLANKIRSHKGIVYDRSKFIERFNRKGINTAMAQSILHYL